jgi:hypothetical protein
LSDKNLNGFKIKKREKGSGIRMATGLVNNREVEERKESRKEGRKKKEGIEYGAYEILFGSHRDVPLKFCRTLHQ